MKVKIERQERQDELPRQGLFGRFAKPEYKTSYLVLLTIELSNEESAVAQKANLLDVCIYEIEIEPRFRIEGVEGIDNSPIPITLRQMLKVPHSRGFEYPAKAHDFENELKTVHLPAIKQMLTYNAKPTTGSDTFEL